MQRAARRDDNEGDIVEALRRHGFTVAKLSMPDVPDLLVARSDHPATLLEVKQPGKRLRQGQQDFADRWPLRIHVVHSPAEALAAFGIIEAP